VIAVGEFALGVPFAGIAGKRPTALQASGLDLQFIGHLARKLLRERENSGSGRVHKLWERLLYLKPKTAKQVGRKRPRNARNPEKEAKGRPSGRELLSGGKGMV
jgi:hypothetical protein